MKQIYELSVKKRLCLTENFEKLKKSSIFMFLWQNNRPKKRLTETEVCVMKKRFVFKPVQNSFHLGH